MKKSPAALIIELGRSSGSKKEAEGDEVEIAKEILAAVEDSDAEALKDALASFIEVCMNEGNED